VCGRWACGRKTVNTVYSEEWKKMCSNKSKFELVPLSFLGLFLPMLWKDYQPRDSVSSVRSART
jgi:hypothetical protein